ncbi:MAG: hypothetical protein A6F71_10905 [Cycloclasticus sp. symbiont of Poecilosclerida sp. M]|nr:MAG: hypothetical protein A6F71_10905 [Cycloclasticus sp. symbiont of Poecilosclerida sp. M]SMN12562.1 hypothetical protein SPBRAN_1771 [uncultured Candidatus Thioglobus sp.]
MKKTVLIIVLVMTGLQSSCSQLKANDINETIFDFVDLLVSDRVVSLSDYEKFYGQSSEQELAFELRICEEKDWDIYSKSCISFTRERWDSPKKEKSLFITWVKEKFLTAGKSYEVISVNPSLEWEGFEHSLIEVLIGEHTFVLFHNTAPDRPTGLLIGISSIDGRSIYSYLPDN